MDRPADVALEAMIRSYDETDHEALRDLVLCLHESLRSFDVDLAPGALIIDRYFREMMSRVARTSGMIFVAEHDGALVGFVSTFGAMPPDDLDERPDPFCFIAELFVRPNCQSQGIGRRLVEHAERFAAGCGSYKIELKVLARNGRAVRFYESLGYAPRVVVMSKRMNEGCSP